MKMLNKKRDRNDENAEQDAGWMRCKCWKCWTRNGIKLIKMLNKKRDKNDENVEQEVG